jgi:hypothetical protein
MRLSHLILLILLLPLKNMAQGTVSGHVYDFEKKTSPLEGVVVKNLTNGKILQTHALGQFTIAAAKGDLLEFSKTGYHTDTLFLTNLAARRVFLPVRANELQEVKILGAKVNSAVYYKDPEAKEFKRFETDDLRGKKNGDRAGGLKFNLGYGKNRSQLNKQKQLAETEAYEEEINANFNEQLISNLIKLTGEDLKVFVYLYKPAVLLVSAERPFNYNGYIVKAYNTWLKLSPEQRRLPAMPKF